MGVVESVSAAIVDGLFYLYMAIALLVGGLVLGWLGYILVKFRARPGSAKPRDAPRAGVLPAERGHPLWSYVMVLVIAAIMFGLAFGTISAVTTLETPPPEGDKVHIEVIGLQFGWRVIFTGDGGIPIATANNWTVPVERPIVANVTSIDVWHNFALPEFRVRIDVIPGQVNKLWWQAHETAVVAPVCVQICGSGHAQMKAVMHIVPQPEFDAYLDAKTRDAYAKLPTANVTFDGATFTVEATDIPTDKAFAARITNTGSATETFRFADHVEAIAPGETALLYASANAGTLTAQTSGATHVFRSVSQ